MRPPRLLTFSALLAFNGGFVDVACFFGLKGLFAAHITGNLATLCATIVLGTRGPLSKIAAVPEFVAIVALTHLAGHALTARNRPAARILLCVQVLLLAAFLALVLRYAPFADPDTPIALATALAAIAAMAVQNGVQRAHLPQLPPTTFMTGNATQFAIDAVDVCRRRATPHVAARFRHVLLNLAGFTVGCAAAGAAYWSWGFACVALALPVAIVAAALTP
jgi:uncharacterized membrane protein YoaK (UPF0700 family)